MAKKSTESKLRKKTKSVKNYVLTSENLTINNLKKRKNKRLNYSTESVEKALKAIKETGMSVRKAATAFGIPVATLGRKKNLEPGKTKSKTGPGTVLTTNEENEIVTWILHRAEIGAPVTKNELLDSVQRYVKIMDKKTPFKDDRPSRHWYESFRKRHPKLSIRKPQQLSTSRAVVTQEDLQDWFENNQKYLEKKNLLNIPPSRIFNCDESSIQLCPDAESVLAAKGTRAVYKIVDGGKEALTVLFTYRADGIRAPPMLLYSYKKTVPKKIIENTPNGWGIGISDNGWMTTETFYEYITNVFYPWLVKENTQFPVIMYMDNHSSHLNLPLVNFCREKKIELIMLPPNSTHIMQPLDISFFHPFKETWRKCVPKWKNEQGVTQVTKENFPLVLQYTLDNMPKAEKVVQSGFRGSGLYPFDPKAVDYDVLNKGKKSKRTLENNNTTKSNEITEQQRFLNQFEENLPEEILLDFKTAANSGSWTGDVDKKALFDYWLNIYKKSTGETPKQKPVIRSNEVLHDPSILETFKYRSRTSQENFLEGVDPGINPLINNRPTHSQECVTNLEARAETVSSDEGWQPLIILDNHLSMTNCDENGIGGNNYNYEIVCDLPVQIINEETLGNTNHTLDTVSNCSPTVTDPVVSSNNNSQLENQNDPINVQLTIENCPYNQDYQQGLENNQENICKSIDGQSSSVKKTSPKAIKKDNSPKKPFKEIFTLPVDYLPKKKRSRVEKSGKSKLPSVGTSDEWYESQLEKEKCKKQQEEKKQRRKELLDEKKKLQEQVKEIQKRLKVEK